MIGTTVGGYQVTGLLAEGGMGAVWAAKHAVMGRDAVIKLLLPELSHHAEMVRRFFNEARAAAAINDPGIVQIFDVGNLPDGRAYIVMERLKGQTLAERLRQSRPQHAGDPLQGLRVEETVNVLRLIARTLDAAHGHGIVHRDLKPDNIFLVHDRDVVGGERTKILDFGIAKLKGDGTQMQVTRAGSIFGTPAYMAPEQCNDAATVDARADLYAVGCIAYEMLTGIPPFGFGGVEILAAHMRDEPMPISSRNPSVPPQLEAIIMRLLRKNVDERFASAAELYRALDAVNMSGTAPTAYSVPPGTSAGYAPAYGSSQIRSAGSQPPVAAGSAAAGSAAISAQQRQTPAPYASYTPPGSQPPDAIAPPAHPPVGTTPPPGTWPHAGTYPPPRSSKLPWVIAGIAIAATAVVVAVVLMKNDAPARQPVAGPASGETDTVKGNPLAEALSAKIARDWDAAIAAAERVVAEDDKQQAAEILAHAREQKQHQATLASIEPLIAANDLAGARQALATIPETSPYRASAQELVTKAEDANNVAIATPKKDPKRDPKKDPKRPAKDPQRDPKKDPATKPDNNDDPDVGNETYDEVMQAARRAEKAFRWGEMFRNARIALKLKPGDLDARMAATIAACGMRARAKALNNLPPKSTGSYWEVAKSRCFALGVDLDN